MVNAIGKMVGPASAGIIFSWSLNNGMQFPLDFHFVFFCSAFLCVINYFLIYTFMDDSINNHPDDFEKCDDNHLRASLQFEPPYI